MLVDNNRPVRRIRYTRRRRCTSYVYLVAGGYRLSYAPRNRISPDCRLRKDTTTIIHRVGRGQRVLTWPRPCDVYVCLFVLYVITLHTPKRRPAVPGKRTRLKPTASVGYQKKKKLKYNYDNDLRARVRYALNGVAYAYIRNTFARESPVGREEVSCYPVSLRFCFSTAKRFRACVSRPSSRVAISVPRGTKNKTTTLFTRSSDTRI